MEMHLIRISFFHFLGELLKDLLHTEMETRPVHFKISSCTSSSWKTQEVLEGGEAYPSSLRFTAHSSISPKTSKRRFSSVRLQSDLSRPTYTTRLSSCSLRGDTDREAGGRLKERECVFLSSPSFNELVLITPVDTAAFTALFTPCIFFYTSLCFFCLSVSCVPLWLAQLSPCYLIEVQMELPPSAQYLPSFFSTTHQAEAERFLSNDATSLSFFFFNSSGGCSCCFYFGGV